MGRRKKKEKTIFLGTIDPIDALKASQPWLGNQRGMIHSSKKDYKRKDKHPKRDIWD